MFSLFLTIIACISTYVKIYTIKYIVSGEDAQGLDGGYSSKHGDGRAKKEVMKTENDRRMNDSEFNPN